jgi:DNA-binding transcriptional LysR family regulator
LQEAKHPVRVETKQVHTTYDGIAALRNGEIDLLLDASPRSLRFDNIQRSRFELPLHHTVLIPKSKKERYGEKPGWLSFEELQDEPIAFVEWQDYARRLFDAKAEVPRVRVTTVSAVIRFVLAADYLGIANNWTAMFPEEYASEFIVKHLRATEYVAESLRVYRRKSPTPGSAVRDLASAIEAFFEKEMKERRFLRAPKVGKSE